MPISAHCPLSTRAQFGLAANRARIHSYEVEPSRRPTRRSVTRVRCLWEKGLVAGVLCVVCVAGGSDTFVTGCFFLRAAHSGGTGASGLRRVCGCGLEKFAL